MNDEIMRLAERMATRSEDCTGAKDAIALQEFAAELRTLARKPDHPKDKLGMVAEGMSGLVEALDAAMVESLLGEGSDIWEGNRGKLRNRLPENVGAILAKMRALLAATPAPDHSAGVGGMVSDDAMVERAAKAVADDWQSRRIKKIPWEQLVHAQKELARPQARIVIAALAQPADAGADGGK